MTVGPGDSLSLVPVHCCGWFIWPAASYRPGIIISSPRRNKLLLSKNLHFSITRDTSNTHLRWSPHFPVTFVPRPCNSTESKPAPLLAKYPSAERLAAWGCSSQLSWTHHCGSRSLKLIEGSCLFLKNTRGPSMNFEEATTKILQFPHSGTRVCCRRSICLRFSTVTSTAIALGETIGLPFLRAK